MADRERRFSFGDFELDPGRFELRERGRAVALEPTPLRLLVYLLRHRDRVVPRRELLERIWPDTRVVDESLTTALRSIRRALGDRARQPLWIATRPRVGYRFIGVVREEPREDHRAAGQGLDPAHVREESGEEVDWWARDAATQKPRTGG